MSRVTESAPVRIFLSYSHKDTRQKEKIVESLQPLEREGVAQIWSDDRISLGTLWDAEIRSRIEQSDIALVLVSTEFLNSPYCRSVEITRFLELRRSGGLRIVPVILFDSDWKNESWLAETQAYPGGEKTLFGSHSGRARIAKALLGLITRVRETIAEVAVQAKPRVAAAAPAASLSAITDEELIAQVFDRDPVVNSAAADALIARRFSNFESMSERLRSVQPLNLLSVRRLFATNVRQSGPVLRDCVMRADVDWHRATGAADSFSPTHRDVFAGPIAERLAESMLHFDIGRNCIDALGQMVASGWGPEILQCLRGNDNPITGYLTSSYTFDKYNVYCIEALAKFFAGARDAADTYYAINRLTEAVEFADTYSHSAAHHRDDALRKVLVTCSPIHADEIVKEWVGHANRKFRVLAAYALGNMRLSRVVTTLIRMLDDSEESVVTEAEIALGNIGSDAAANALLQRESGWLALALAVAAIPDREKCLATARDLINETAGVNGRWMGIRAAGVRGLTELRGEIATHLYAEDPMDRGASALALVRLGDVSRFAQIRRALEEAGDARERVLTTLAVIALGDPLSAEAENRLRRDLCDCAGFMRLVQEDVLGTLGASGTLSLVRIATSWTPVYASQADY